MTVMEIDVHEYRDSDHEIDPLFVERWSPRAMSGEELEDEEIAALFEAARWAPSSYNAQPWRFFYARRGTESWDLFFGWLNDFNQKWAEDAALLVVIASRKRFEHNDEPARTHSFDTGAAWQNLALQGASMGLVVHGMQGFDYEVAHRDLGLPDVYAVEAMVAVGKPGKVSDLPESMQEREQPSDRKPLEEIVTEGKYRG